MQKRSELEGGLHKSTKVIEGVVGGTIKVVGGVTKWATQVVKSRSHRDIVCDLELIPPLPCIVTISNKVTSAIDVGIVFPTCYESGLTNRHAKGVALHEGISPLKTHIPGL
jgi:hypothetical protein